MSDKHAIIDIGSNTVRLVIYDGPSRAPVVLLNEKVTARLGKDVARDGLLSERAMGTALSSLARYAVLLRVMAVTDVEVVATAAVRDAANGKAFLAQVRALGLEPRLLTGAEEALTSAQGVIAAFPGARGVAGDLGGGSLELITMAGGACGTGITLPLGTLRLPELRATGGARFNGEVRRKLRAARWQAGRGEPFFLVGGSWRALARYAMHRLGWPLDDPHGFELDPQTARKLCRSLARGKPINVPGIPASRLASLPDAAALLAAMLREIEPSRLIFSSWGLREGLLYSKLDKTTRAQDPMLAGVAAFARSFGISVASATMVAGWTAAVAPHGESGDERLRMAATMLTLASMRNEPNLRADHAMDWALRKRWIGLDVRGRAMIAVAILANTGRTEVPAALTPLASPSDFREAITWGLAIRLCRKLTACAPQTMPLAALAPDGGRLLLKLREPAEPLYSGSVAKDHRLLAEWLSLEATIVRLPAEAPVGQSRQGHASA